PASSPACRSLPLNAGKSMQKVTSPGHDHSYATLVGRSYDLPVALGASWLNNRLHAGLRESFEAIGEREEGIARRDSSLRPLARLPDREMRRLHPARLAHPDPN